MLAKAKRLLFDIKTDIKIIKDDIAKRKKTDELTIDDFIFHCYSIGLQDKPDGSIECDIFKLDITGGELNNKNINNVVCSFTENFSFQNVYFNNIVILITTNEPTKFAGTYYESLLVDEDDINAIENGMTDNYIKVFNIVYGPNGLTYTFNDECKINIDTINKVQPKSLHITRNQTKYGFRNEANGFTFVYQTGSELTNDLTIKEGNNFVNSISETALSLIHINDMLSSALNTQYISIVGTLFVKKSYLLNNKIEVAMDKFLLKSEYENSEYLNELEKIDNRYTGRISSIYDTLSSTYTYDSIHNKLINDIYNINKKVKPLYNDNSCPDFDCCDIRDVRIHLYNLLTKNTDVVVKDGKYCYIKEIEFENEDDFVNEKNKKIYIKTPTNNHFSFEPYITDIIVEDEQLFKKFMFTDPFLIRELLLNNMDAVVDLDNGISDSLEKKEEKEKIIEYCNIINGRINNYASYYYDKYQLSFGSINKILSGIPPDRTLPKPKPSYNYSSLLIKLMKQYYDELETDENGEAIDIQTINALFSSYSQIKKVNTYIDAVIVDGVLYKSSGISDKSIIEVSLPKDDNEIVNIQFITNIMSILNYLNETHIIPSTTITFS